MAVDFSELNVQITLSISELRSLVAMINLASEALQMSDRAVPPVVDEVSGLYFRLMESIEQDGYLGEFTPEQ